jgi:hypothetical protein
MSSLSFSRRLKAGWTKEQLMKYYCLSEAQYTKVVECLKRISEAGQPHSRTLDEGKREAR